MSDHALRPGLSECVVTTAAMCCDRRLARIITGNTRQLQPEIGDFPEFFRDLTDF
jgi:hypothetical protein